MNKIKFTLDDVEEMLEEVGFEWVSRFIYNPNTEKYKELKVNTFKKNKTHFLSLKNKINGIRSLAMTEIDENTFIIRINDCKLDASDGWVEKIIQKSVQAKC